MTLEEDELRRALEARSGVPSPEFRSRLSRALTTRPVSPNLMPAVAFAIAVVLTVTSVGVLVGARHFGRPAGTAASGPRVTSGSRVETPPPSASPTPSSGAELSVPSASVVWALVGGHRLYRSTDQGKTWVKRFAPPTPPQGDPPPLIAFIDARNGWELVPTSGDKQCSREDAELWRTTDGAATWKLISQTHQASYLVLDQCKDAMYFKDATHGSLATGDPRTDLSSMFATQDGGATWTPVGLLHRPETYAFRVFSITTVDGSEMVEAHANVGWPGQPAADIRNNRPLGYIFVNEAPSSDGYTWLGSLRTVPDQAVSNVAFLTPTRWLIVQPGLETTDAGASWHPFTTDFADVGGGAGVFAFANDKVGYGTAQGRIYRTIDGGTHWELIKSSWP